VALEVGEAMEIARSPGQSCTWQEPGRQRSSGYETINVMPVTPRIGAEVAGLTLARPLSNRQVEELHLALAEHQVLFFRDQPLDVESHKALGARSSSRRLLFVRMLCDCFKYGGCG
jgi:Taurine catabolism dioxygenase TauD, TfdA family